MEACPKHAILSIMKLVESFQEKPVTTRYRGQTSLKILESSARQQSKPWSTDVLGYKAAWKLCTQTGRYGLGMVCVQTLSWVLLLPAAWERSLVSSIHNANKQEEFPWASCEPICLCYISAALAPSSQASHTLDFSRTYACPLLPLCALEAVLLRLFSKWLPLIFTIARMFCLKTKLCTTQEVNASSIAYMAIFRNRVKKSVRFHVLCFKEMHIQVGYMQLHLHRWWLTEPL